MPFELEEYNVLLLITAYSIVLLFAQGPPAQFPRRTNGMTTYFRQCIVEASERTGYEL